MLRIKQMYKIHGMRTANGICRSAGNDTFYTTYERALEQARYYVGQAGCHDSMVIYKAHVLVRKSHPPIEVMTIEYGGHIVPLQ